MTRSVLEREFCDVISLKIDKLPDSNFASGMLLWLDSRNDTKTGPAIQF